MSDECLMKQETVFSFCTQYQAVMRKFTLAENTRGALRGKGQTAPTSATDERGDYMLLIMHILSMAGIFDKDGIAFNCVCIVPFVSISHMIASPARDYWFTSQ